MEYSVKRDATLHEAALSGKFTYTDNGKFRDFVAEVEKNAPKALNVDMSEVTYVDSAALGMLLLLKEAADKHETGITLSGARGQVRKILELSRFDQLFTIV